MMCLCAVSVMLVNEFLQIKTEQDLRDKEPDDQHCQVRSGNEGQHCGERQRSGCEAEVRCAHRC